MTTDLEDQLRAYFGELAVSTPVEQPVSFAPRLTHVQVLSSHSARPRQLALVSSITLVVLAVAAFAVLQKRDPTPSGIGSTTPAPVDSTTPSTTPEPVGVDGAVLWAPSTSSAVRIVGYTSWEAAAGSTGAVVAPDGRVFGLTLNAYYPDTPAEGELRHVGGFDVRAIADATAPAEVYRLIHDGCLSFGIITAGEDPWSDNTTALINGLTLDPTDAQLKLPTGWTSLGSSALMAQYGLDIAVTAGGTTNTISLFQMPGAPAGAYLQGMESPPQPVALDGGGTVWVIHGVTTDGFNEIVGERNGTAFRLMGVATSAQLLDLAATMTQAPSSDWTTHRDTNVTPGTAQPPPPECVVPTLTVVP